MTVMQRLRRTFVTGFFVVVPLVVSVVALVWLFRWADNLTSGFAARVGLEHIPGLGILVTAAIVLAVGVLATNMLGRRLLERTEQLLLHVPLFRTIYAPVKQLLSAFSPDSETGFKRMVFIEDPVRGYVLGFLTKEFTLDRGHGRETLLAVYVPTNHLYLGDVVLCPPERAVFPDMTVEEGIRVFLTGGMALPDRIAVERDPARAISTTKINPNS
jgi:uncharacterized membrane protein